jgi:hypothetical protein
MKPGNPASYRAGKYPYTDDAPFVIGRSTSAKLFTLDTSILHSTVKKPALLKTTAASMIRTLWRAFVCLFTNAETNDTFDDGGKL